MPGAGDLSSHHRVLLSPASREAEDVPGPGGADTGVKFICNLRSGCPGSFRDPQRQRVQCVSVVLLAHPSRKAGFLVDCQIHYLFLFSHLMWLDTSSRTGPLLAGSGGWAGTCAVSPSRRKCKRLGHQSNKTRNATFSP